MEEWTVRHLIDLPCASEFKTCFELRNMPVVLEGAVKTWRAYTSWDTSTGGLQRLKDLAGSSTVQAMASTSSNFFGEIRGHERTEIAFGEILDIAGASLRECGSSMESESVRGVCSAAELSEGEASLSRDVYQRQFYLAQVPMYDSGATATAPLHPLMNDISLPEFLKSDGAVSNINFWMSVNGSRSSIHYDPYHNLLCVVVGSKEVALWPPSAAKVLYPLPIYGEASNHSSVNFAKPDYEVHPLFKEAVQHCQTVNLVAGDALFIPEGWYHQVNSEGLTIAVNIWWPSKISLALGTHMDGYYLRRVVACLVDSEKDLMLAKLCTCDDGRRSDEKEAVVDRPTLPRALAGHACGSLRKVKPRFNGSAQKSNAEVTPGTGYDGLTKLTPLEAQYLRTLVLGVSSRFEDGTPSVGPKESEDPLAAQEMNTNSSPLDGVEDIGKNMESVAQVFYSLEPAVLQRILLIMIDEFPHTLEALILYSLSPAAAEALTRKFDQMDSSENSQQFFKSFYNIFDDPNAAMTALLNGKEAFAAQALKNVMEGMLGK